MSLRISCITVTASSTVTLKLSFSPPLTGMRKEAKSRHKKNMIGSKKFAISWSSATYLSHCPDRCCDDALDLLRNRRISCNTVTARSTVTLKLSFSPPLSEIRKEDKSRHKKNRTGIKKLTM
ncbi:hypothetical protein EYF80_037080 [Liparis tanakae]|uniref:Uncharacterized protein n=1 Tax=Liparis tanakae TaxID=230148 RepID=A0A4Z2GHA5_9TELE|nr:hypothetical protein EYF80_037080 [Liparis tanakae]